jgi:Leucine-rich repeat (LRR) protein
MPVLPSAAPPRLSRSLHAPLLEHNLPAWLSHASTQRRDALKQAAAPVPDWYRQATPEQRTRLNDAAVASFAAQTRLDHTVAGVHSIEAFAEPLLIKALQTHFNVQLDVHTTLLHLKKPVELGVLGIDISSFEVLRLPLLQAALHNFEEAEGEEGAFHASSGFLNETTPGDGSEVRTSLTVAQFIRLCRALDIGALYQAYLKPLLYPTAGSGQALRSAFIDTQKTALAAAAHLALLKKDIRPDDLRMIQAVISGSANPRLDGKPVWFRDLSLMKHRLTGCVVFVISEKYRYSDDLLLYIPNEPQAPLKRYTWAQLNAVFKQRFTQRDADAPADGSPSAYARFFSQFVAYADRPDYFRQLTTDAPARPGLAGPFATLMNDVLNGVNPFSLFTGIKKLPPTPPKPQAHNPDPFLALGAMVRAGHGLWADNIDLWDYLFDRHREQLLADARSHAVPTADVDARVRSEKFSRLLSIGMLVFNFAAMLVPVLGEVMMGVMVSQLLLETFEGALEWAEGDRRAAKAHLIDVAENLALVVATAGAGKAVGKLLAVKPEPVIERTEAVTSVDGKTRLWKPDLERYESPVVLAPEARPNAQGQYLHDGRTFMRQAGKLYEQTFDTTAQRWRLQHPTDPHAYSPPLTHNGLGAWRHTLERPLGWDRLTLLRRMGHVTEPFTDEQLLSIADISSTEDAALRKMHMDNTPAPPVLADTLRLFDADRSVARVIEQVQSGQSIDQHYLYILPLVTEMPRWPIGRVLEVIDEGAVIKYGSERRVPRALRKPAIRITRADVLGSRLPARILEALDDNEVTQLLGGEGARVRDNRAQEFRRQIADYARTRQPALFESLYQGAAPKESMVTKLQRLYPGLGDAAARAVLEQADGLQLERLRQTHKVPRAMQEHARWFVRQGRLRHAYAGLMMENLVSASSKRLALHTLARLPGWSDSLRLEMREGHIGGELLDAIGSEHAATRKYLVKKGTLFQSFNERGEELNSLPREGDNFYASIMHALPDETRQALGLPQVSQSPQLRRAIIDQALAQRLESAQIVEGQAPRRAWFKPPQRLSQTLIGYPASGHGEGLIDSLVSRLQDVYPGLNNDPARAFILQRLRAGESDQQILTFINNRQREGEQLARTLNEWVGQGVALNGRRPAADRLLASWRRSLMVDVPGFDGLELYSNDLLPALEADFSHVRRLTFGGQGFTDATIGQWLERFPQVEELGVGIIPPVQLRSVPRVLSALPRLTRLTITTGVPFDAEQMAQLQGMRALQALDLDGVPSPGQALDVSQMTQLHSLTVRRTFLPGLPTGVLDLPQLRRLELRGSGIRELPAQMFEPGHEHVWEGLQVDWSMFERTAFRRAYDYVSAQPRHLVDVEEMVSRYCEGELRRLSGAGSVSTEFSVFTGQMAQLRSAFFRRWADAAARFEAIEALSTQYAHWSERLENWATAPLPDGEMGQRSSVASHLNTSWYNGLLQRYGVTNAATALDGSSWRLSSYPPLPEEGFDHVRSLTLRGPDLPVQDLRAFVSSLRQLRTLDLSQSELIELPQAPGDFATLEHLDLSDNPLDELDVSGMHRLRSLNLHNTDLTEWPTGAETLADLAWLDLRNTEITHLPPAALASDELILGINLEDTPLTDDAQAALDAAMHRVELDRGLPVGRLRQFAAERVPAGFPPTETGVSIARHLLPLPSPEDVVVAPPDVRLTRLWPGLQEGEAQQWVARMRNDGMSDEQLHARLTQWRSDAQTLTRSLNGWLFTRESRGQGWFVTAHARLQAALRILDTWRAGLGVRRVEAGTALSLEGLELEALPELPALFDHVETLNLSNTRLYENGPDTFLRAFAQVRTLILNTNELTGLPAALEGMTRLERLELSANGFSDPERLYPVLERLPHLQWLDLSYNALPTFRVNGLPRLRTLDLNSNGLETWPEGVLQAPALRTLNLRNNNIGEIPAEALDGTHEPLMAGVDLSDNNELSEDSLERLQAYAGIGGRDGALGMSNADINNMLARSDSDSETGSDTDSAVGNNHEFEDPFGVQPDEALPEQSVTQEHLAAWLDALASEERPEFQALWRRLGPGDEPELDAELAANRQAFFNLLSQLRNTVEFRLARSTLARRVMQVLRAADEDSELRHLLFVMSRTHGTCVDGRILTFSNLEVKVFEHNALQGVDLTRPDQRGAALLQYSRQLFRVEQVEALAKLSTGRHHDAAEVSLAYREGLREPLQLPGQPVHMAFTTPIRGAEREQALKAVQAAERSETFYQYLIGLEHWTRYLEQRYPEDFSALERRRELAHDQVESSEHSSDEDYGEALQRLDIQHQLERSQLLIRLSRLETGEPARDPNQPGTSRDLLGPGR